MEKHFIPLSVPNFSGREKEYVNDAVVSEWVSTGGSLVPKFEQAIADYCGAAGAVAAAAGAHALGTGTAVKGAAAGALKVKIAAGIAAVGLVAGGVGVALHEPAITFQDPVFEHNIRILLDKPEGPLRTSDLAQIGSLYITADGMALEEIFSEEQMA